MKQVGPQQFRLFLSFIVATLCFLEVYQDFPFDGVSSKVLFADGIWAFVGAIALFSLLGSVYKLMRLSMEKNKAREGFRIAPQSR